MRRDVGVIATHGGTSARVHTNASESRPCARLPCTVQSCTLARSITRYPVSSRSFPNDVAQLRTTINAFAARETFPPAAMASADSAAR